MIELLLAGLAAIGALFGWVQIERGRRKSAERRAETAEKSYEAERDRATVDADVATGGDPRDRLRNDWSR